jgi:hypothetical protein
MPRHGQKPGGQLGCSAARAKHLIEIRSLFAAQVRVAKYEVRIGTDDREQIVEVVGDSTSELPRRVHALGVVVVNLKALATRDVDGGDGNPAIQLENAKLEPALATTGELEGILHLAGAAPFEGLTNPPEHLGAFDAGVTLLHAAPQQLLSRAFTVLRSHPIQVAVAHRAINQLDTDRQLIEKRRKSLERVV